MNKIKISSGERVFGVINVFMMCIFTCIMFYPMWHVVCASFSNPAEYMAHKGILVRPLGFSLDAYKAMSNNPMILKGYMNTLYIVLASLVLNVIMTPIAAYVVSRKNSKWSKRIMVMIVFTMYFSGGMIPIYFNIRDLGLLDTHWAIILPGAIGTFNMIIMKSSFESIPSSLEESAWIDGAGHYTILFRIFLPLTKATLSVILLYYAVAHWNGWFNAMLYLNNREMFPLQLILREILIQNDTTSMMQNIDAGDKALISEIVRYAVIVVATVPILCIYPFIQKYFERGIMIGAVKG